MTTYLFRSILCLAILLLVYLIFLEKEKMHRFNRWYLLGSIVFACIVPLISFNVAATSLPILQDNYFEIPNMGNDQVTQAPVTASLNTIPGPANYLIPALWTIYAAITFILLLRFTRNIYLLLSSAAKNKMVMHRGASLVLLKEKVASHSFLHYIFISEEEYAKGALEQEVITHELTHVKEKHSWDVIFIELLQTICWFNPLFFFYKKAIQLNHEYLADDAVIKTYDNVPAYQCLLLDKITLNSNLYLSSSFNYSVTKKRLVMMTRTMNGTRVFLKKISIIPVLAAAVFFFSTKSIAQNPPAVTPKSGEIASTKEGVSQQVLDEFDAIIKKNMGKTRNGHEVLLNLEDKDRDRLETIYLQMSREQQAESKVFFLKKIIHKNSGAPSDALFESFKDPAKFGVWINERKVTNDVLNKYKASDFGDYWSSNLNYTEKMKQDVMKEFNLTTMYEKQLELSTKQVADERLKNDIAEAKRRPNSMLYRYNKKRMRYVD